MWQVLVPPVGTVFEQPQLARRVVDGEGAHVRCMVERRSQRERIFRHCVQKLMIGMNRQKGGIQDLSGQLRLVHLTGRRMEAADIDPFAVALSHSESRAMGHELEAGVSAEVHVEVLCLARQGGERKDKKQAECAALDHHFLAVTAWVQLSP